MELSEIMKRKIENGREYRAMNMTARAEAGEGEMIAEGYATTFNEPYYLFGNNEYKVFEQVDPKAFDDCDMSDVIFQYNHEGRVFARNKNGTLNLDIDEHGLKVTADLSGTEIGKQLYEEIKGGYTDKMSFGFIVAEDEIKEVNKEEETIITRTITKISKLFDVSAVSIPANDMTSISARAYADGVIGKAELEKFERAQKIKRIKLLMEV